MQIDIELALIKMPKDKLQSLEKVLPKGFFIEDRTSHGWGMVIRFDTELKGNISEVINLFLVPLLPLNNIIDNAEYCGTLRIGVFYSTATCTMLFDTCFLLNRFGLMIEVTTYPTSE